MSRLITAFVSRVLFVVMTLTLLSPALGAQLVSDHEQLHSHAQHVDASSLPHEHDADDDQDNAHAFVGHLFVHLPLYLGGDRPVAFPGVASGGKMQARQFSPSFRAPEIPFKPPRASSFV